MDANALARIAEAVCEQDEPALIYQAFPAGRDKPYCYADDRDPVRALENLAQSEGITDYSIDTDARRVVLCPRFMRQTFYMYR